MTLCSLIMSGKDHCHPPPPEELPTPYEYFAKFFDEMMCERLTFETNLYSVQQSGKSLGVTGEEMRKYLSILVLCGVIKMPQFRMFWQGGTRYAPVADLMSRNRFEEIHRFLHMNNNMEQKPKGIEGHDKLFKVRPIIDALRQNLRLVPPEEKQSIDEQIIPFKGRSQMKQYIKAKPHKWGFKVFTRASSSGIMHDFVIYEGKGTATDHGLGISGDIVLDLVRDLPQGINHKVFFDNWFSSLRLVEHLKKEGYLSVGTVRSDRTEKCPLALDSELKSQGRGAVDYKLDAESGVQVIKWLDNATVQLVSSYAGVQPTDTCTRWSNKEKKQIEVTRPIAVKEYNDSMGGVDQQICSSSYIVPTTSHESGT
ncbi:piggyBac transposable element-derived protein 3-like [Ixodes scapularis]|uniref:piggyBac transposable element-derived protein 3-like n=1 Tax=Ixodes scapularis TaxID=6945 RepID=UPI001A9EBF5A|nr:piggyBac transposable element-derived protein 3-like [Ixodes scapularis]